MTILVDECRWPWRNRLWCHLISDVSYDELHRFARRLGIPRVAFQGDHYDLHETGRAAALNQGATAVTSRDILRALTHSGLRRGPAFKRGGLGAVLGLPAPRLVTERLVLRQWKPDDVPAMHAIESDPHVMQHLGGPATLQETEQRINYEATGLALRGIGKWALERRDTGELIGRVGLGPVDARLAFAPALEAGWRLSVASQGHGFATEAAQAVFRYGFDVLEVDRISAYTLPENIASRAVMARLSMVEAGEFDHPGFTPPKRHVVAWLGRSRPTA